MEASAWPSFETPRKVRGSSRDNGEAVAGMTVWVNYENAWMPVMARPRINAWTSWVPS
jgi:hypothetical protein